MDTTRKWHKLSILSFILSLIQPLLLVIGLVFTADLVRANNALAFVFPAVPLILLALNCAALNLAKRRNERGKGFALAGIIFSVLVVLFVLLILLVLVAAREMPPV